MSAEGTVDGDWGFELAVDFTSAHVLKDAFITYAGFKPFKLSLGYFKAPFSLEYQTSSRFTTFQERSLLHEAYDPPKRIGAGFGTFSTLAGGAFTAAAGVFGGTVPAHTGAHGGSGVGFTGRVTDAFVHTSSELLHVGVDTAHMLMSCRI